MLDAGRIQPATVESRRSVTPALDAGRALANALGLDPRQVTITSHPAPAGARQLAVVQSAPLIERLNEMMNVSDNVMAECIAREVAASMHRPLSFAGAVDAVTNRLNTAHVDTGGATLQDSSGLSVDDRLTAKTLDGVVQAAAGPDQPSLRPLLDLLPIAGGSGTLSDRFLDATNQRRAGRLVAGQNRLADRHQRVSRGGHRPQRTGADLRVHLQRRRAERPQGDRRAGHHAVVVWMRTMTASADLTVGRTVDWRFAATVGQWLARPGPPSTDYTRRQVIDELATAAKAAEPPVRDVTGLDTDGVVPEARIVDRPGWIRAAAESMRVMTGGTDKPRGFITGRITGAQTGAVLAFVASGILGQYDPFAAADDGGALLLVYPERHRRRAAIAGRAFRFPAVGVPARGHPPGAVHRQSVAVRLHVAGAGRVDPTPATTSRRW